MKVNKYGNYKRQLKIDEIKQRFHLHQKSRHHDSEQEVKSWTSQHNQPQQLQFS